MGANCDTELPRARARPPGSPSAPAGEMEMGVVAFGCFANERRVRRHSGRSAPLLCFAFCIVARADGQTGGRADGLASERRNGSTGEGWRRALDDVARTR